MENKEDFIFDGTDIKEALRNEGFLLIINNTQGRGLMGQEANTATVSGVDGARLLDITFPERDITIDYTLVAGDLVGLREAESLLASLLVRETVKPLSFADQKGIFNAVLTGFETSLETSNIQQGTITFLCPDPFRYKDDIEITDMSFTANVPQEITVDANYYSEAWIEVKLSTDVAELVLSINGAEIKYKGETSLKSGQLVVFDGQSYECRVDGQLRVLEITGDYPLLKSKMNAITVNNSSWLAIKYKERDI